MVLILGRPDAHGVLQVAGRSKDPTPATATATATATGAVLGADLEGPPRPSSRNSVPHLATCHHGGNADQD
jgi:hypothetical protein